LLIEKLFKDKYVKVVDNGYLIGEFPSEISAKYFQAEINLENVHNLWILLAKTVLDISNEYFYSKTDRTTFFIELKILVDSLNTITYMENVIHFPSFKSEVTSKNGKFYIRVKESRK